MPGWTVATIVLPNLLRELPKFKSNPSQGLSTPCNDVSKPTSSEVRYDADAPLDAAAGADGDHRLGLDRVGPMERHLPGLVRPQVPTEVRDVLQILFFPLCRESLNVALQVW